MVASAASTLPDRLTGGSVKTINVQGHSVANRKALQKSPAMRTAPENSFEVPFTHSLGKSESAVTPLYLPFDMDGDEKEWKVGGFSTYSACLGPAGEANDDWMISPAIHLLAGKVYVMTFDEGVNTPNGTKAAVHGVYMGDSQTVEAMTTTIVPDHEVYTDFSTVEQAFTVPADGYYYFGFRCATTQAKTAIFKLRNFGIEESDMPVAPDTYFEVPFTHSLGKSESEVTPLYLPFDMDGDEKEWRVGGFSTYSACLGPAGDANNDWMISPAIHLVAGKEYALTFDEGVNTPNGTKAAVHGVYMGTSQAVDAMTTAVVPDHEVFTDFTTVEKNFTVPADGYYYFGFRCATTKAKTAIFKLRNFGIYVASEKIDPPAAGELSYVLAPKGELKATVTYTAPTKTVTGGDVYSISKVEVKTNWIVSHTFTDVEPGQTITFETELYNSAYNRIEATAYTGDEAGETCSILNFYAGADNPLPPTGLKVELSDDYKHVTFSWDPVDETGENGGYVDTEKVTYYIFDAFGSYYDPALATTEDTSITFDYSDFDGQDFVAYQVTAGIDEMYYSLEATSDIVIVGDPELLPFGESFSNAYYSQVWAIDPESTSSGILCGTLYDNELQTNAEDYDAEPEYLNSQDGDNGFFYIMPMEKDAVYGFFSTKIDISAAANPVFEFWYQGKGSALDAMVAADGGKFAPVRTIDLKAEPTDDWTLCRVDLAQFKDARYIQIELRLRAIHNDDETMWSVPIDNIRVRDLVSADLRLVNLYAPASLVPGSSALVEAYVENLGTETCSGAVAKLFKDGQEVESITLPDMAPDAFASAKFNVAASVLDADELNFTVELVAAGDAVVANNSSSATVKVAHSILPGVNDLAAVAADGKVSLSWSAPDLGEITKPASRFEDFENPDYEALTISDFGGWTLYDADKRKTYNILQETGNPYQTQPQAFQLYNPVKAGVRQEYLIDVQPYSGDQMLIAWSAQGQNDNWLISPELSGEAQTISFFAKSFTIAYPETFEVLYSTAGINVSDFVKIENVGNYPANGMVAEEWTEYTAELPEGARYFAIRHTADDTYALYIDDISFIAASEIPADTEIEGYNIYRDGVLVNDAPVAAAGFEDCPAVSGSYVYRVSVVYNSGQSRACEPVEVVFVTTGAASVGQTGVKVKAADGCIEVAGAEGLDVLVATPDGKVIYSGVTGSNVRIPVSSGVYIVRAGSFVTKTVL